MKLLAAVAAVLFVSSAFCQEPPQNARPAYEAASVKPNNSASGNTSTQGSQGQVLMTNRSLKTLVEEAYQLKPFQVSGPGWMETAHFDIVAKYPADTKNSDRPLMLRTLLEDRFKLAVHRESKEMPGYALVVAKSGFKLQPIDSEGTHISVNGNGRVQTVTAKMPMKSLADFLARQLDQMVVDQTGISGAYDFQFRWAKDDQTSADTAGETAPSLFTAIQETLGVRLQPQKVPVDMIVVDHVEREPTEN